MDKKLAQNRLSDGSGFTLVEVLISLVLSSLAMTAIYSIYQSQQKSYVAESQVAGMQQNIRAAMYYMQKELRMAGCDPTGTAGAGMVVANDSTVQFTMDLNTTDSDGIPDGDTTDTDEDITYAIADGDADGDIDLVRTDNGVTRMIAENIDALNFVYLDSSSAVLATPVANLSNIRTVQVTIVARTSQIDNDYTNSSEYKNKQGTTILAAQNDRYRRTLLTTHINCRNLGL